MLLVAAFGHNLQHSGSCIDLLHSGTCSELFSPDTCCDLLHSGTYSDLLVIIKRACMCASDRIVCESASQADLGFNFSLALSRTCRVLPLPDQA